MKRLIAFIITFAPIVSAFAQVTAQQLMGAGMSAQLATVVAGIGTGGTVVNNATWLKFRNAANSADIKWFKGDASDNSQINAATGKVIRFSVAETPVADLGASGFATDVSYAAGGYQDKFPAAAVITPSTSVPTPSAGNTLTERYTILAAGAPTAAYVVLPVATSSVGKSYTVYNQGSNPLAIVPQTGSINVTGALTPFSCTTLKECQCRGLSTSTFGCSQQ